MLIEHRIDHVNEGFIGRKEAVSARQKVAFEHPFDSVLTEHLDDTSICREFAAVSVRRSRIQQLAADGNPLAAWLLPVLEHPESLDRYIGASQIGITLSSLVLGAYAQQTFAVWLTPYFAELGGLQQVAAQTTSTAVVLLTLTTAQVVFAELVPKLVALQYPTQASL